MRIRRQQRLDSSSTFSPVVVVVDDDDDDDEEEEEEEGEDDDDDDKDKGVDEMKAGALSSVSAEYQGHHPDDCSGTMICSASKLRASFNWLDKLRAAKGFPVEPDLPMDHFLCSRDSLSLEESQAFNGSCSSNLFSPDTARVSPASVTETPSADSANENNFSDDKHSVACTQITILDSTQKDGDVLGVASLKTLSMAAERCSSSTTISHAFTSVSAKRIPKSISDGSDLKERTPSVRLRSEACLETNGSINRYGNVRIVAEVATQQPGTQKLTNLFADLFGMDDANDIDKKPDFPGAGFGKRHKRKQEKPRLCPTSSDPHVFVKVETAEVHELENQMSIDEKLVSRTVDMLGLSKDKNAVVDKNLLDRKDMGSTLTDSSDRKEECGSMITSTEIFVIDTSYPTWKAEKILLKRGNDWKVRDKLNLPCPESTEISVKEFRSKNKGLRTSHLSPSNLHPKGAWPAKNKGRRKWQFSSFSGTIDKPARKRAMIEEVWGSVPQTQLRSCRKRRICSGLVDGAVDTNVIVDTRSQQPKNISSLALDHPANQPEETLIFSIYQVFLQAGKSGLTAREAVSKILERSLPGLHEGGVVPRVEVLKIISNSPYFMLLEESKYILCSALVGDDEQSPNCKSSLLQDRRIATAEEKARLENVKKARQRGISQYWAAYAAIRRARTGNTRRKSSSELCILKAPLSQEIMSRKRLKSVKQEMAGLGNPCNRSDGKGWHCPLRAKVGYLLCDHHLDRFRIKSHIKSRMYSINTSARERFRNHGDSWMVKRVVERSRSSRHFHGEREGKQCLTTLNTPSSEILENH